MLSGHESTDMCAVHVLSKIHNQMYCVGSFGHNNYTGKACEGMKGKSCGGMKRYVGEWERSGRDGREGWKERDKRGRKEKR